MTMKKLLRPVLTVLLLGALLTSCKNKAPKEARLIPKNASFVFVMDAKSMQDKLQKGGISVDALLKKVFQNDSTDQKDKELLNDLNNNAGINWNSRIFVFTTQKMVGSAPETAVSFLTELTDPAKFEAFLKKQPDMAGKEFKKEGTYNYVMPEKSVMISWSDKNVLATLYTSTGGKPVYDTTTMTFKAPEEVDVTAALKTEVNAYFTQKESESLAGNDIFNDMFKEKADGYMFTNSNSALAALTMLPMQLPKLEELLKDNFTASTLSFENGRIIAKTTSYPNKLASGLLKQYSGATVNMSMLEHYPSQSINGVMMASFNPEIIGGLLKQLEVEGLANAALQKSGLTTQDIYKALKGDIAFIVSDLSITQPEPQAGQDEVTMTRKKPMGKMILNANIGDKAAFAKLMDKAVEQGFVVKNGAGYKGGALLSMLGFYLHADEKNFILASDSLTYAKYVSNTEKVVLSNDVMKQFKGKSMVAYFDIARTIDGFMAGAGKTGFDKSMHTARNTFKDAIATSDNFDGKTLRGAFELRMQDEKQNSLVTLMSLITDVATDMREQAKRQREMEDKIFPAGVPAIIRTN